MAKTPLIAAAIAVVTAALFAAAAGNGFVGYDDGEYITDNPHVRTGWSRANAVWAFTASHSNNWHPLTWISHQIDASAFGLDPKGHHAVSIALHAANAALLFVWLSRLAFPAALAAFVALGFAVHPLRVESVAWAAERKDVLSCLFAILALIAYTEWTRRRGWMLYVVTAIALAAGLLSKQMLVTLPVLFLILDRWPLARTDSWARRVVEKLPLFALSAGFSTAAILVQRASGAASALEDLPLGPRLSNAAVAFVRYLGKIAWPADLSVFYPMHPAQPWQLAAALAILATISVLAFRSRQTRPWLAAGWLWFLIALLPVIGIIQVGMQSMADRYTYLPSIGLLLAISRQFAAWPRAAMAVGPLLLIAWSAVTWRQIPVWQDGVTLFTHALQSDPENFVAHDNLGVELDRRGRHEEALHHYRETIRIKPGDRNGESNFALASFAKGERLIAANKPDDALAAFQEGLRYRPRHALARTHVGRILSAKQKIPEALAEFRIAIEADPKLAAAHMGKAVALSWAGRPAEARPAFEETLRLEPGNVEAHYDLGIVLAVLGQFGPARQHFETAARLAPGFAPAREALRQMGAQPSGR